MLAVLTWIYCLWPRYGVDDRSRSSQSSYRH